MHVKGVYLGVHCVYQTVDSVVICCKIAINLNSSIPGPAPLISSTYKRLPVGAFFV